ncbi:diaminopimelate decarboxylase [Streptomyces sp. NBC_01210]|uniref:diaminopimelate decarboxylase n=1 Tax=Streptomyces sp. NBC_01210 TaxID=2903774 RepID=UPI002E0E447D|nr:diaminopimelate decarboxylase [Streptomyces sp. NBC_01210]
MAAEFHIQGVPVSDLAAEFGTPLYVYDAETVTRQYSGLRDLLHPAVEIFYSLKANPNIAICALLHSLGARAEVSSLAELTTAGRAGVAAEDIVFPGPGKSEEELTACLDAGIAAIVCESLDELALVDRLAAERGVTARVALRVNPSFSVKGAKLVMSGTGRQFGIDQETLLAQPDLAERFLSVRLVGIHIYMGTRVLDEQVVAEHTERIFEAAEQIADALGFPLELVDIGGGLGVPYFEGERDLDPSVLTALLNPLIEKFTAGRPKTRIIMELGRYLTAPAGVYVTRVRYLKESRGERFAIVDGGTHHHMAAVGVGSFVKRNFPIQLLSRTGAEADEVWNIAGPLCTPNDTLGKKVRLPSLETGDLVGVLQSGAYGPSASPVHFLSHGHPAEVLVYEGRPLLVRERDRPEDLLVRQRSYDFTGASGDTAGAAT